MIPAFVPKVAISSAFEAFLHIDIYLIVAAYTIFRSEYVYSGTGEGEPMEDNAQARAEKLFRQDKVFTLTDITSRLECSTRTAQRRLTQWKSHTSYNFNGRYHTLPGIPRFDHYGIWKYRGICFSRHGNLTDTVVKLVETSASGLTISLLCSILDVPAQSFRTFFSKIDRICHARLDNRVVYLSSDDVQRQRQLDRRCGVHDGLPADAAAVVVLVDRIKFPQSTIEECVGRVGKLTPGVTVESVRNLLGVHGLLKKTAHSNS